MTLPRKVRFLLRTAGVPPAALVLFWERAASAASSPKKTAAETAALPGSPALRVSRPLASEAAPDPSRKACSASRSVSWGGGGGRTPSDKTGRRPATAPSASRPARRSTAPAWRRSPSTLPSTPHRDRVRDRPARGQFRGGSCRGPRSPSFGRRSVWRVRCGPAGSGSGTCTPQPGGRCRSTQIASRATHACPLTGRPVLAPVPAPQFDSPVLRAAMVSDRPGNSARRWPVRQPPSEARARQTPRKAIPPPRPARSRRSTRRRTGRRVSSATAP